FVQLYNLANIAARETATIRLAPADVPVAYAALQEAMGKAKARVLVARLDEQDRQNIVGQLDFEIRRADEGALQLALGKAGESLSRNVIRAPEGDAVTDSKILFKVSLISANSLRPKESTTLKLAAADVPVAYAAVQEAAGKAKARVINSKLDEHDRQNITGQL